MESASGISESSSSTWPGVLRANLRIVPANGIASTIFDTGSAPETGSGSGVRLASPLVWKRSPSLSLSRSTTR